MNAVKESNEPVLLTLDT